MHRMIRSLLLALGLGVAGLAWAQELGLDTFVGSSGRVFPKAMKASPLLRAWLRRWHRAPRAPHPQPRRDAMKWHDMTRFR